MSTLAVVLIPQMGAGFWLDIENSANILGSELRYSAHRALATGRLHRWVVDLDRQVFRVEWMEEGLTEFEAELPTHAGLLDLRPPEPQHEFHPIAERRGEWRWLDEPGVEIHAVRVGDDLVESGLASIAFSAGGGADPAAIRLLGEEGQRIEVRVTAFTGEVRVDDDPVEWN